MRTTTICFLFFYCCFIQVSAQDASVYKYIETSKNPFGKYNPKAPKQLQDYKDLIGISDCVSTARKPNQAWGKPVKMSWKWKYIMNGMGIQDETIKSDGTHSGSIRQYDKDSLRWNVHYYTSRATIQQLPVWNGNTKSGNIVLYRKQAAPNGKEGFFRLTFYEISKKKIKWVGEWVDTTETITYATWKISCTKRKEGMPNSK